MVGITLLKILNSSDAIFILDNDDLDAYKDFLQKKNRKNSLPKVDFTIMRNLKRFLKIIKHNDINCD